MFEYHLYSTFFSTKKSLLTLPSYIFYLNTDACLLSNNIYDYHIVSQGKISVASIDDADEFTLTDVIVFQLFYIKRYNLIPPSLICYQKKTKAKNS